MPKQARRASASSVGTKTSEKTKNSGDAGGKKDQKPQKVDRKEAFDGRAALHVGLCGLEDDPRWEKS